MRVLDCKEDKCIQLTAHAPQSLDYLDEESRNHFKRLLEYLDELELPYTINTRLVRGLDYYTKTVFEIWSTDKEGKKYSLGGGGRYDGLIQSLGGEATPAIGFGVGTDRIVLENEAYSSQAISGTEVARVLSAARRYGQKEKS